ncbi:MAG: hypothetical protein ABIT38_13275, partial [Gemmatimonadaceae bacterium]
MSSQESNEGDHSASAALLAPAASHRPVEDADVSAAGVNQSATPAGTTSPPPAPTSKRAPYDRSIVEGALLPAVWRIAWPTMLQNVIGGLQGVIDHAMVG